VFIRGDGRVGVAPDDVREQGGRVTPDGVVVIAAFTIVAGECDLGWGCCCAASRWRCAHA